MENYNGKLFSHLKKGDPAIRDDMNNLEGAELSEIGQIKPNSVLSHSYVQP